MRQGQRGLPTNLLWNTSNMGTTRPPEQSGSLTVGVNLDVGTRPWRRLVVQTCVRWLSDHHSSKKASRLTLYSTTVADWNSVGCPEIWSSTSVTTKVLWFSRQSFSLLWPRQIKGDFTSPNNKSGQSLCKVWVFSFGAVSVWLWERCESGVRTVWAVWNGVSGVS
jgi:hypothetical protein